MNFDYKYDPRPTTNTELSRELLTNISEKLGLGVAKKTTKLSGGFSNSNFVIEFENNFRCVARISSEVNRLQKEADLLNKLSETIPTLPVPKILYSSDGQLVGDLGCLVMSFIEGNTIAEVEDSLSPVDCRSICEQTAAYAAEIHGIRFEKNGFLGAGLDIVNPFPSYKLGTVGYLEFCLENERLKSRIGPERTKALAVYLTDRSDLHSPIGTEQLCHGDFNQKNILVAKNTAGNWYVSSILDWEFALSASGVMDIANFLRFEHESPVSDAKWFIDAYRNSGGLLSDNWRLQSMFSDLMAQCSFLIEEPERPKTQATAINVIDRYIAEIDG